MTATRRWCGRRFLVRHINEPLVTAATRASWAGAPWSVRWSRSIPFVMAGKAPARGLDFGDRDELLVIDIREVREPPGAHSRRAGTTTAATVTLLSL